MWREAGNVCILWLCKCLGPASDSIRPTVRNACQCPGSRLSFPAWLLLWWRGEAVNAKSDVFNLSCLTVQRRTSWLNCVVIFSQYWKWWHLCEMQWKYRVYICLQPRVYYSILSVSVKWETWSSILRSIIWPLMCLNADVQYDLSRNDTAEILSISAIQKASCL